MKWFLLLLWDPIRALDLETDGKIDHGKISGWVMAWSILATLILTDGKTPSAAHTVALLAAAQGARVFIAAFKAKTERATQVARIEATNGTVPDFIPHRWQDGSEDGVL